ncbi:SDR family oxidoreductase [Frigidibacter sp. RF13]|uniref:SDR family oxidoreductase n=1 Tax=Frigidibacter sp. RF13 TaxID=2997340 RepID=UPI0022711BC1|nr:SDR family oxidoreductase [Frigidibacter sp. RF13]MCY1126280.1 SDR family oxidoreductase [Frigidibacter sp. RF13]
MRVLITGAGRGIGAGLLAAYRDGGHVAFGTVRGRPGAGEIGMDVRDPVSVAEAAEAFGAGPLDLLICNAGVLPRGAAPDLWAEGFAVNVTGVFLTAQAFLPALRRAEGAKIAILASAMGSSTRAPGGSYIYRASKAAAVNLGRNLATDLRPEGIAVGIYHPGWVKTGMGGAPAEITVAQSVGGLMARIEALSPATSGVFEDWAGRPVPF